MEVHHARKSDVNAVIDLATTRKGMVEGIFDDDETDYDELMYVMKT